MLWRALTFEFRFPRPTLVMGILNVTPDSFSDGGRFVDLAAAVAHGREMVRQGADLLDIGGESTRPGSVPVPEAEELRRVLPVIQELAREVPVPLSIDTLKPGVAAAAVAAGAAIVNDIAANRADPGMARLLADTGAGYVAMHMLGTPQTMQADPRYEDVLATVQDFFRTTLIRLRSAGVAPSQVVLDTGIGFGKTLDHNLELLANMAAFREHGRPLLVGVSRKSFIDRLAGAKVEARLPGSLAAACLAVGEGAAIVRTHDVRETVQALRVAEGILARRRERH